MISFKCGIFKCQTQKKRVEWRLSVLRIVGKVDNANVSKTSMVGCNINFKMQIVLDKLFLYSVNLRLMYIFV